MKRIKDLIIVGLAVAVVVLGVQNANLADQVEREQAEKDALMDDVMHVEYVLNEYKAVYDGLELFEDGSWTYKDGVDEYYFWNWDLQYVGK